MSLLGRLGEGCWALGFIEGGIQQIMENDTYEVKWVKAPKERLYADPFILDVTSTEILVLVEDYEYKLAKGVISLLHINRHTMEILTRKVLLELPTHLSFPNIYRRNGEVYVYPESARSGKQDIYRFDFISEELHPCATICDDILWDSDISEHFGKPLLFTAAHDDYHLDIYQWKEDLQRFIPWKSISDNSRNARLGGALFEYQGKIYYPAQNSEKGYGEHVDIKEIFYKDGEFVVSEVKSIYSSHPTFKRGLHTINEYKGIVVIDVHGYRYGIIGRIIQGLVKIKKYIKRLLSK